jgi:hypothetical protein
MRLMIRSGGEAGGWFLFLQYPILTTGYALLSKNRQKWT